MPGAFQLMTASVRDEPKITRGVPQRRRRRLARARPRRVRGLRALLPARLRRATSSRRGSRRSTASRRSSEPARASPTSAAATAPRRSSWRRRSRRSTFVGFDYHDGSIETRARARAARPASPTACASRSRRRPTIPAAATTSSRRSTACTTWATRSAPPATSASSLADDGTWLIVEPVRGRHACEDNLNPVGRVYYAASTLLCTPASLSQDVRARARRAGRRGAAARRRDRRRLHPLPPRGRDAVQPRARGAAVSGLRCPAVPSGAGDARADARPLPRREGHVDRDGVRVGLRGLRHGRADDRCSCRRGRSSTRALEEQIPYLARHFRVVDVRRPRQRRVGPAARRRAPTPSAEFAPTTRWRSWTRRAPSGRSLVGLSRGAPLRARCSPPSTRARAARSSAIAPAMPLADAPRTSAIAPLRRGPATRRGLGEVQPATTGGATTAGFLEFFFAQMFREPHSTKQIEDARRLGPGDRRRDAPGPHAERGARGPRDERAALRARVALPGARAPRRPRTGSSPPARGARAGRARPAATSCSLEGAGPRPARARPREGQPACCATSSMPPRPPRRAGAAAGRRSRRRALFVSSPIGLGHARRDVAIAQRAAPPACPTSRSTGSPRTRSRACSRPRGERIHPASRHLANESAPHRVASAAEHDLHASRRSRRMDEILCANFMVFHDVVRDERYDLWIGDEAWEIDYFLHENPEREARRLRLADRLRRLAADGRRRRARGVPDRRLQRRDDRAHRALPARARPRDLRRQPRRHRRASASGPSCPRSATGPSSTSTSPATSPASTPPACDREALRAELGYGPRRAGLRRDRRRLRRRRRTCCGALIGGVPRGRAAGCPGLRMIVVAGPRIDPASLPAHDGLEVARLRPRPLPPPRGVRPRRRAGRADDGDGAHRRRSARSSTSRCATTSSRTSTCATGSSATAPGRRMDFETRRPDGDRRGDRRGDRARGRLPRCRARRRRARRRAHRRAALGPSGLRPAA